MIVNIYENTPKPLPIEDDDKEAVIEPLTVTENGEYTAPEGVDGYNPVNVNVQSGGGDTRLKELIEGTLTELYDADITSVTTSAFRSKSSLVEVNLPNVEQVGMNAFDGCKNLKTVNCPKITRVNHSSFNRCSALESIDFPYLKSLDSYSFAACNNVETINLPSVTYIGNDNGLGGKVEHLVLPKVDTLRSSAVSRYFGFSLDLPVIAKISEASSIAAFGLKALILRNTDTMVTLVSSGLLSPLHITGTVNSTYNPNGDKDGYIYVPRMFLSDEDETKDYRRATNWTAYGADRFRAIEDWTVDGTVNGEMDWEKIKGGATA